MAQCASGADRKRLNYQPNRPERRRDVAELRRRPGLVRPTYRTKYTACEGKVQDSLPPLAGKKTKGGRSSGKEQSIAASGQQVGSTVSPKRPDMPRDSSQKLRESGYFSQQWTTRSRYNQTHECYFPIVSGQHTHERGGVFRPLVTLADCLASGACLPLKTWKGRPWSHHTPRNPLPCSLRRRPAQSAPIAASDRTPQPAYTHSARSRTRRRKWRR
jgi:hypothetical protein